MYTGSSITLIKKLIKSLNNNHFLESDWSGPVLGAQCSKSEVISPLGWVPNKSVPGGLVPPELTDQQLLRQQKIICKIAIAAFIVTGNDEFRARCAIASNGRAVMIRSSFAL